MEYKDMLTITMTTDGIPDGEGYIGSRYINSSDKVQRHTFGVRTWRFVEEQDERDIEKWVNTPNGVCYLCGDISPRIINRTCDRCNPLIEAGCGCFVTLTSLEMCLNCRVTTCGSSCNWQHVNNKCNPLLK
jgi:hypothetical protein